MRIAGVTVVLGVLALSYAVPVRSWWYQRGQLAAVEAELAAVEADVAALETEGERWQDPAFIRAQARERLNFVLPGEVGVVVLGLEDLLAGEEPPPDSGVVVPARVDEAPWWVGLWDGFEVAGGVGTGPTVPEESLGGILAEQP